MEIYVAEIPPLAGFTGKERDVETGLDYFGARYYNNQRGQCLTVDPTHHWASPCDHLGTILRKSAGPR